MKAREKLLWLCYFQMMMDYIYDKHRRNMYKIHIGYVENVYCAGK